LIPATTTPVTTAGSALILRQTPSWFPPPKSPLPPPEHARRILIQPQILLPAEPRRPAPR
jgi:hypothetical protein